MNHNINAIVFKGFEEIEAVGTIALLKRAGLTVDIACLHDYSATGRYDVTISNLKNLDEVNYKEYGLIFIPGGPEYVELSKQFIDLQGKFSALEKTYSALGDELASLKEFKLSAERQQKQDMIDSFYMLGDADKQDVIEHIDTYSLDEIEAKLAITCVRNRVNFNVDSNNSENNTNNPQSLFSLNSVTEQDSAPDWIKAVRATAKKQ